MKGKGTKRAISAGEVGFNVAAISCASAMASFFVEGFSFQFPVMKGFLSNSWVAEEAPKLVATLDAGFATKADAVVATARRDATVSFIFRILTLIVLYTQNFSQKHASRIIHLCVPQFRISRLLMLALVEILNSKKVTEDANATQHCYFLHTYDALHTCSLVS
jgi:hypothetical protein